MSSSLRRGEISDKNVDKGKRDRQQKKNIFKFFKLCRGKRFILGELKPQ